jgi:dihydrolipoamide dehydrogenase
MENTTTKKTDVLVIGGGSAGYSAAIRAAQMGAGVVLIEKDKIGGTCLNYGCVPSKFLWHSAKLLKEAKKMVEYGLNIELKGFDFPKNTEKRNRVIDTLVRGIRSVLDSWGIETIKGSARFLAPKQIEVAKDDGSKIRIDASKVIIAAGSSPRGVPGLEIDHKKFIDSTDALSLKEIPKSLLIIGGGSIGVEFAYYFSVFGARVTLFECEKCILPREDNEFSSEIKKMLEFEGVKVFEGGDVPGTLLEQAELVLVAIGRKPNIESLGLKAGGIEFSKAGIKTDAFLKTTEPDTFACGDVLGKWNLAYTAQAEGVCAGENALGKKNTVDYSCIPKVYFSDTMLASTGACAEEGASVGRYTMMANSVAHIRGEKKGFVKILSDNYTGRIIGGKIVGSNASDMISQLSAAIKNKLCVSDLTRELFFHPSLSEAIFEAGEDNHKKCVHTPREKLK